MYVIKCGSFTEFLETVAGLVRRGFHFEANQETLTINLTGGY